MAKFITKGMAQKAWTLRHYENESVRSIAAILGISPTTAALIIREWDFYQAHEPKINHNRGLNGRWHKRQRPEFQTEERKEREREKLRQERKQEEIDLAKSLTPIEIKKTLALIRREQKKRRKQLTHCTLTIVL